MKKHLFWLSLALAICLLPAVAGALDLDDWIWRRATFWEEPSDAADLGLPEDEPVPLFAAPFDEAFPLEPIPTGESFTLRGTLQAQTWAMVKTGDGRVGWIKIDPGACELPNDSDLEIQRMLCRVTGEAEASFTPGGSPARTLHEGDTVIVMLADKDSGLAYAETDVDDKVAWLYMDAGALEEVELIEVDGNTNTVRICEGVTILGDNYTWTFVEEEDEEGEWRGHTFIYTVIRPGDISGGRVDLSELMGYDTETTLILPDSLRMMGAESIVYGYCTEFRLPEGLEYFDIDAIYGTNFNRIIIPAGYTAELPVGYYVTVGVYEVEEGNPCYKSVDGVLFSTDGKTLIRYPNGQSDTHYDVPAGTEVIASYAFDDDSMNSPLKTISLPIGLKRIESFAFAGCGRLQSLTVPLTVTEIADSAFYACVSLERLSLPPGLTVEWYGSAVQGDFTWYNGDNGSTQEWKERKLYFGNYTARVVSPNGEAKETLWADAAYTEPVGTIFANALVRVEDVEGDAAHVRLQEWKESDWIAQGGYWGWGDKLYWIPLECLEADTTGSTLFKLTGAVNNATGERYDEYDVDISNGKAYVDIRDYFDPEDYWWIYREEEFTADEITLLRNGDSSRILAYLCAPDDSPIPVLDAPGGDEIGQVWDCEQAIVLEQRDGWAYVRTIRLTGWVKEERVWVVEAE
ncbi:MAG: leucine-rich repeat domain-containing protein [Clostridia bacterium]|nr:leucine-rich repeat domain-containing protein [Clostridia bacterium]